MAQPVSSWGVRGSVGVVVMSLVTSLAGCAAERMYAGRPRPTGEVALVVTSLSEAAVLESIDGKKVSTSADRFEILPGQHTLRVRQGNTANAIPRSAGRTDLPLEAEPGHTYRLRGAEDPPSARWRAWVEDSGVAIPSGRTAEALERTCRDGEPASCVELGARYDRGEMELGWDEKRAAELYEHACKADHPTGCLNLGRLRESGRGVPRDERQAAGLFSAACKAGHLRACTHLGVLLQEGRGQARDARRAAVLYRSACEDGDPAGCYRLGALIREGSEGAADYGRAAAFYEKACTGGEPEGCTGLGLLYENGLGVEQDEPRAARLYEKACAEGSALGCANLGVLLQLGVGVVKDERRAAAMFRRACVRGTASACASLEALAPEFRVDDADEVARSLAASPASLPVPVSMPSPVSSALVAGNSRALCIEYTPVGSHIPIRDCPQVQVNTPEVTAAKQPDPAEVAAPSQEAGPGLEASLAPLLYAFAPHPMGIEGFQVSARGELDVLQLGFLPAISVEYSGELFAAVATAILRFPPAVRLEGRLYAFAWGPVRPYLGLGGSMFFPAVAPRATFGLDVTAFRFHVFADLAAERFINPAPGYGEFSLLLSAGAGWHF